MERTLSVEERIKRAEEIYNRRMGNEDRRRVTIPQEEKKDIKLLKKLILQIIACLLIYFIFYNIQNNNYIFSEDFTSKAKEILSYDTNFPQLYENAKQWILQFVNKEKNDEEEMNVITPEESIGGAVENEVVNEEVQDNKTTDNNNDTNNIDTTSEQTELTQEEKDIKAIKETTSFIKPVEGIISSKFGQREPTTSTVPKNHTGTDIAANTGTKIKAATDGEVVLSSEQGDYGKHLKIQIGEVSIIYAHCNNLYVKQGDKITQGQEIAEVGSTGNSTGPHLHFEIRYQERTIDPQKILDL